MRLFRSWLFVLTIFVGRPLFASEIARWEVGKPGNASNLTVLNAEPNKWKLTQREKFAVAAIDLTHDYYRRAEFVAKLGKPATFPLWLQVEYLDDGYGLVSVGEQMRASR